MSYFRRMTRRAPVHPVLARAVSQQMLGGTRIKAKAADQAVLDKATYEHLKRILEQARVRGGL